MIMIEIHLWAMGHGPFRVLPVIKDMFSTASVALF